MSTTATLSPAPSAIFVAPLPRSFHFNGITLADLPGLGVEQVKAYYSSLYPELATAAVEMGEVRDGVQTVTFQRQVGSKG